MSNPSPTMLHLLGRLGDGWELTASAIPRPGWGARYQLTLGPQVEYPDARTVRALVDRKWLVFGMLTKAGERALAEHRAGAMP